MKRSIQTSVSEFIGRHHGAAMALCCIVPIAMIAAFSLSGIARGSGGRPLSLAASLLCPISMIAMMLFMRKDHDHGGEKEVSGRTCHAASEKNIDDPNAMDLAGGKSGDPKLFS